MALVNALNDNYPIVAEPAPDVVRLRFAITDLKQSRPVLSGVTSVLCRRVSHQHREERGDGLVDGVRRDKCQK